VLALALLAASRPAHAQCPSGVRPRVLVMVDTSSSETLRLSDAVATGGDGSTLYTDAVLTRGLTQSPGFGLDPGYQTSGPVCPPASPPTTLSAFDGANSRLYAIKGALADAVAAWGGVDWGLERYAGSTCAVVNTTSSIGRSCTNDSTCGGGGFCISGQCYKDNNLCRTTTAYDVACNANGQSAITYTGTCGTGAAAGSGACATPQVCYADADCTTGYAGQCAPIAGGAASSCACGGASNCPPSYTCSSGRCVYSAACQNPGGVILVDPTTAGSSGQVPPWLDGVEALAGNLLSIPANPELRSDGNTPLAGAARSATAWYNNIKNNNLDPQIACRPYVLVEITDGTDTCDADAVNGPAAAAGSFVAATVYGAKRLNKVYVIGVAMGTTPVPALDAIAKAGGTGSARLATTRADIAAALADVVRTSVLVETCNNGDDDCNGACDEPFPDVAVTAAGCSNRHSAKACSNRAVPGTHCYATGVYVCSADQLSEVCSAATCATVPSLCPTSEAAGGCNGGDDDCNGVIDDCAAGVANSCCS
jgi:hypothetical protein